MENYEHENLIHTNRVRCPTFQSEYDVTRSRMPLMPSRPDVDRNYTHMKNKSPANTKCFSTTRLFDTMVSPKNKYIVK